MTRSALHLPEAELEIMMALWEGESPMTSNQIMAALEGRQTWGLTTVLNFLSRLADRGFVRAEKKGRANLYHVLVTKEEYLKEANADFLNRLHGSSILQLVSSLYETGVITDSDLAAMRRYIDEKEKAKGDIPHWLL